eukprot:jgi/Phyca11/20974/fgenesh1_pg.PHYCAscaffold_78_\
MCGHLAHVSSISHDHRIHEVAGFVLLRSWNSLSAPNALVIHTPKFESALVKVLGGKATRLTAAEKVLLQPFRRVTAAAAPLDDEQSTSFAEQILKRRKVEAAPECLFSPA